MRPSVVGTCRCADVHASNTPTGCAEQAVDERVGVIESCIAIVRSVRTIGEVTGGGVIIVEMRVGKELRGPEADNNNERRSSTKA